MGQCFPLPADPLVRAELAKHTRNHLRVWNMFNFARRIRPGSDMFKARRTRGMRRLGSQLEQSGVALLSSQLQIC